MKANATKFAKTELVSAPIDGKCITLHDYFDGLMMSLGEKSNGNCLFSFQDCLFLIPYENKEIRDLYGNPFVSTIYMIQKKLKEELANNPDCWQDGMTDSFEDYSIRFKGFRNGCVVFALYQEFCRNMGNSGMWRAISPTDDHDAEQKALKDIQDYMTECNDDDTDDVNYVYTDTDIIQATDSHYELHFAFYYPKKNIF